jgi:hypothetical protein
MKRSYRKTILSEATPKGRLCLTVTVENSEVTRAVISCNKFPLQSYHNVKAARAAFKRMVVEGIPEQGVVAADSLAESIYTKPHTLAEPVSLLTLAHLDCLLTKSKARSHRHAIVALGVCKIVGRGQIPLTEKEFVAWLFQCFERIAFRYKTKSNAKQKSHCFVRVLKRACEYPLAFPTLSKLVINHLPLMQERCVFVVAKSNAVVSRKPYSLSECDKFIEHALDFKSACLFILSLSLGTRGDDSRKIQPKHIRDGRIHLNEFYSKASSTDLPLAPLVVKTILNLQLDFTDCEISWEKTRVRPSCAVMLNLAGVPPIEVKARLAHKTISMLVSHYVKHLPEDYRSGNYFGVAPVTVANHKTSENAWDNWLLFKLLKVSQRFKKFDSVKSALIGLLEKGSEKESLQLASF